MKRAIGRDELEREIIFVPGDALQRSAVEKSGHNRPAPRIEVAIWRDNRVANRFWRPASCEAAEVGREEPAFAVNHVAAGASTLAEEDFPATLSISGQLDAGGRSLQSSKMSNERSPGFRVQETERGHRRIRHAVLKDLQNRSIGKAARLRPRHDVRRTLSAFSVKAVTSGAIRGINSFAGRCIRWFRRFVLTPRVGAANQDGACDELQKWQPPAHAGHRDSTSNDFEHQFSAYESHNQRFKNVDVKCTSSIHQMSGTVSNHFILSTSENYAQPGIESEIGFNDIEVWVAFSGSVQTIQNIPFQSI
jgi:hypothetical protein